MSLSSCEQIFELPEETHVSVCKLHLFLISLWGTYVHDQRVPRHEKLSQRRPVSGKISYEIELRPSLGTVRELDALRHRLPLLVDHIQGLLPVFNRLAVY